MKKYIDNANIIIEHTKLIVQNIDDDTDFEEIFNFVSKHINITELIIKDNNSESFNILNAYLLPDNITHLEIHNNSFLESIINLNNNITHLYATNNSKLKHISNIPINCIELDLSKNFMLENINCINDSLTQLETLNLSYTIISNIDNLPDNIKLLFTEACQELITINKLPLNLNKWISNSGQLKYINCELPSFLINLDISYNQLESILNIPNNIKTIDLTYNQISILPDIPENIDYIDVSKNPLTNITIDILTQLDLITAATVLYDSHHENNHHEEYENYEEIKYLNQGSHQNDENIRTVYDIFDKGNEEFNDNRKLLLDFLSDNEYKNNDRENNKNNDDNNENDISFNDYGTSDYSKSNPNYISVKIPSYVL